jgi:predicted AAA+ superfamily ATPase
LNQFNGGAILDEAQRCPALFSYLQTRVDERPQPGEYILTGSQQFGLLSGITQSLAGRAALLTLLPMTYGELQRSGKIGKNLDKTLFDGAYPPSSTADSNHTLGMATMCVLISNAMSGN